MKKKFEEFLELTKNVPKELEFDIISGTHKINHYISAATDIAPLAAQKLLEAVEILEEQSKQLEDCKKALMAYGWGSEKAGSWMHDLQVLINKTKQFTEDFNND
jgi:hypothetical protein